MMRLVAYAPDGVRRFPVHRSEMIIGSWPECDILQARSISAMGLCGELAERN